MPNQDNIDNVTEEVFNIMDKAKAEIVQDLLKLKNEGSTDEYIQAVNTLDLKALLVKKIDKAKQLFIAHNKVVLEETIPFGDVKDANK